MPSVIDFTRCVEKVKDLELQSCEEAFWQHPESAQATLSETAELKATVSRVNSWGRSVEDISMLLSLVAVGQG